MKKFLKWFGIIVGSLIILLISVIAYILISHDRYGLYSSGGPLSENQAKYDVIYYGINLEIFAEDQAIGGNVDVKMRALDDSIETIELDLIDNFDVSSITDIKNNSLEFEHDDDKLMIRLNKIPDLNDLIDLNIEYEGQPVEALLPPWIGGVNWSKDSSGADWIGLSCQTDGAKIWMPCKDHPSDEPDSVAINITIPEPYYCAASGVLRNITKPKPGFRTFHWITHYPINNYDINFNIGMYDVLDSTYIADDGTVMPVYFYVLPQSRIGAERHLAMAMDMLYTYRKIYGEYPFIKEKFSIVETDYLGMEHQTLNSYGNKYNYDTVDSLEVDWLMLHKMGHEWWGNKLTAKDWADMWLQEGICTYGEALYMREKLGEEAYHAHVDSIRSLVQNRKPIIPKRNATSYEGYSGDIYMKGACLMHSLRFMLGDDTFFKMLKEFITDSASPLPDCQPCHNYIYCHTNLRFGVPYPG
ncbi:MAG: M1 family metallopeptidase, partial [Calditrichaceae bacterium]